jgi:hypothetical protein
MGFDFEPDEEDYVSVDAMPDQGSPSLDTTHFKKSQQNNPLEHTPKPRVRGTGLRTFLPLTILATLVSMCSATVNPVVGVASCMSDRISAYGGVKPMMFHYDRHGDVGKWDVSDAKLFLSQGCKLNHDDLDSSARKFLDSFDAALPHTGKTPGYIDLKDLEQSLQLIGWKETSAHSFLPALPDFVLVTLPAFPPQCIGQCQQPWPLLRREGTIPTEESQNCIVSSFVDCIRAGKSCETCDEESSCRISNALIEFQSPRLAGNPLIVSRSFLPSLVEIDTQLAQCSSRRPNPRVQGGYSKTATSAAIMAGFGFQLSSTWPSCADLSNTRASYDPITKVVSQKAYQSFKGIPESSLSAAWEHSCYKVVRSPVPRRPEAASTTIDEETTPVASPKPCLQLTDAIFPCTWWRSCFEAETQCGAEGFGRVEETSCTTSSNFNDLDVRSKQAFDKFQICTRNTVVRRFVTANTSDTNCSSFSPTLASIKAIHQQCMFNADFCSVLSDPTVGSLKFMQMLNSVTPYAKSACRTFATCWPAVFPDPSLLAVIGCELPTPPTVNLVMTLPSSFQLTSMIGQPSGQSRVDEYASPEGIIPGSALFDGCGHDATCGNADDVPGRNATDMVAMIELMSQHKTTSKFMIAHLVSSNSLTCIVDILIMRSVSLGAELQSLLSHGS